MKFASKQHAFQVFAKVYIFLTLLSPLVMAMEGYFSPIRPALLFAMPGNQMYVFQFLLSIAAADAGYQWLMWIFMINIFALPVFLLVAYLLLAKKQKTWLMKTLLLLDGAFPLYFAVASGLQGQLVHMPINGLCLILGGVMDLASFVLLYWMERKGGSENETNGNLEAVDI